MSYIKDMARFTKARAVAQATMNQIIAERVPLNDRLRSVYLPIILIETSCMLAEDIIGGLRYLKEDRTKKLCRSIKEAIETARKDRINVTKIDLYRKIIEAAEKFHKTLKEDVTKYKLAYDHQLLNIPNNCNKLQLDLAETAYVVRDIMVFILKFDREFNSRVQSLVGDCIEYDAKDDNFCVQIILAIDTLLEVYGLPKVLKSEHTLLAYEIFKKKTKLIDTSLD